MKVIELQKQEPKWRVENRDLSFAVVADHCSETPFWKNIDPNAEQHAHEYCEKLNEASPNTYQAAVVILTGDLDKPVEGRWSNRGTDLALNGKLYMSIGSDAPCFASALNLYEKITGTQI